MYLPYSGINPLNRESRSFYSLLCGGCGGGGQPKFMIVTQIFAPTCGPQIFREKMEANLTHDDVMIVVYERREVRVAT